MIDLVRCTTPECARLTTGYLCTQCIVELDDLLADVPALIPLLAGARAGTAIVRKPGQGAGGSHPGSREPGSLDAMLLQTWLQQLPSRAYDEADNNPNAGRTLYMARIWVPQARHLVWGAEQEEVDHDELRERIRDIAPPMPTRELLPWLRTKARITITSMDIRDWARRGKLVPVEREPQPTYHPHEVLDAWHDTRGRK
ncbi:hypothetical protein ArV2_gp66 [Arthrobacter phage vB_ArS-ArV2]|uniref:Helix-turn-helix DNA binding domain protein n=1 Tax=Arthrobacter phage vB_ArS-ArV2 TaxID=1414742 RepID=V5R9D8_9CAUD|nr:hypothetical protein ArV2_gp66 [Arthrobacter phage vB_ArS-ArV2]AHB31677.1 hypothetical protein ArV2_gp66 [Arthrobacter phage vB_ArS-ArV2]